jgi:hypothetical protein
MYAVKGKRSCAKIYINIISLNRKALFKRFIKKVHIIKHK